MTIAELMETPSGGLSILGVPIEASDRDFIAFWREKIPDDFMEGNPICQHSLVFEMSGIERGRNLIQSYSALVPVAGKTVLDIGAGNGGMCIAAALSGATQVYGIEYEDYRIPLANKWAKCRGAKVVIKQGVAESLPFADASIDTVFLWSVIEHVESHDKTFSEIARVLRPGGTVVINGPNRLSPANFMSDPHYLMMAVSALPRPIAKWWVTKVRKAAKEYGVGIFPIFSLMLRRMRKYGLTPVLEDHSNYLVERLASPEKIASGYSRSFVKLISLFGLNRLAIDAIRNTSRMFIVIASKSAGN